MSRLPLLGTLLALTLSSTALASKAPDRDQDGLPDRWEQRFHVKSAAADNDRDKLENQTEYAIGTDPRSRNSDHKGKADGAEDKDRDGLSNYFEQQTLNDPADRDTDDDGVRDGNENAGRIASYDQDTGELTIKTDRKKVSGFVDEAGVSCADEDSGSGEEEGEDPDVSDAIRQLIRPNLAEPEDPADEESHGDEDSEDIEDCGAGELETGAWVHEAEFDEDDGGVFAFVEVVK